jgi:hypothetical protein
VSYDGSLKAWDADSLEIVVDRSSAHGGERVHCLAVGPDGLLYTGGDDKVGGGMPTACCGCYGCCEGLQLVDCIAWRLSSHLPAAGL